MSLVLEFSEDIRSNSKSNSFSGGVRKVIDDDVSTVKLATDGDRVAILRQAGLLGVAVGVGVTVFVFMAVRRFVFMAVFVAVLVAVLVTMLVAVTMRMLVAVVVAAVRVVVAAVRVSALVSLLGRSSGRDSECRLLDLQIRDTGRLHQLHQIAGRTREVHHIITAFRCVEWCFHA